MSCYERDAGRGIEVVVAWGASGTSATERTEGGALRCAALRRWLLPLGIPITLFFLDLTPCNRNRIATMASASSSPLPVCVVGYGGSSRTFHIPYLQAMPHAFTLHSIQQRPGSTSGPPASKDHPAALVLGSFDEVLTTLPKPGLVVISTSNATHYPFARRALEAGYHVVCEKPITWRHAEALDLARLAKEHGLVCASFNNRRWDGDFLTVQSLLHPPASQPDQPSALGEATYFESRFDRFRPWSKGGWREEAGFDEGGGLLLDLGSHLGDQRAYEWRDGGLAYSFVLTLTLPSSRTQSSPSSAPPPA